MANDTLEPAKTTPVSARIPTGIKSELEEEAALRGHTVSEAITYMLQEFFPLYKENVPVVFRRVSETTEAQAA